MKKNLQILELLSAYLDDELNAKDKSEVERLLSSSLEMRKELDDLKRIKQLGSRINRIPDSPFFETRLMAEIESRKKNSSGIKRWIPAASLVALTIALMIVLKLDPDLIDKIWEDQKVAIAGFYKENLQPVLLAANLSNEDIFNFAFNNELPLDDSRQKYLLLGYDDSGKEFFEIRSSDQKIKRQSYDEFVTAMNLDEKQKQTVDSIIGSYSKALEAQVLVNENNTIAINPNLWNLRKAIFADLLVASEKLNKAKFERIVPEGISNNEKVEFNPELANRLLDEAGWSQRNAQGIRTKNGVPLSIEASITKPQERFVTPYQQELRKAGVDLKLKNEDWTSTIKNIDARNFTVFPFGYSGLVTPNPETSLSSKLADKSDNNNIQGVKNARIDVLLDEYDKTFDVKRQVEIIREIDGISDSIYYDAMQWNPRGIRVAYWDKFGMPEYVLPRQAQLSYVYQTIALTWWYEPEKAAAIAEAKKSKKDLGGNKDIQEVLYWKNLK